MSRLSKNISYLRTQNGFSQRRLAEALGVGRGTVYNWESEKANPPIDELVKLSRLFKLSIDNLILTDLEESGVLSANEPSEIYNLSTPNNYFIPISVQAGYGIGSTGILEHELTPIFIPGVDYVARTFEVYGDSMEPVLQHKDWVVCEQVQDAQSIQESQPCVVVSKSDGITVKYVLKYHEGLMCIPANREQYSSVMVPYDEIQEIWIVRIRLTKHLIPPQVTSHNSALEDRMNNMERFIQDTFPDFNIVEFRKTKST